MPGIFARNIVGDDDAVSVLRSGTQSLARRAESLRVSRHESTAAFSARNRTARLADRFVKHANDLYINRLAEAEPLFRRALAVAEASLVPGRPTTPIYRKNLELLLTKLGAASHSS